jgi:hypothetical protein
LASDSVKIDTLLIYISPYILMAAAQKKWKLPLHYDDSDPKARTLESEILDTLRIKKQTLYTHLPAEKFPREDGYIVGIKLAEKVVPTYTATPVVAFTMDDLDEIEDTQEVSEKLLISASEPAISLCELKDSARKANNKVAEKYKMLDNSSRSKAKKEVVPEWFKSSIWRKTHGPLEKVQCPVCSLNLISVDSFSAGHILAESKGGMMCSENIIPICPECNSQMGTRHLYWFAWHYYGKVLWPVY